MTPAVSCYAAIGVQGDRSCPELEQHVHCKNCPVYASAAGALLDRELPADYRTTWARHFGDRPPSTVDELDSVLIFRLGAEWLALPATVIDEVASLQAVHVLPHRQNGLVLGVTNVRGELCICVSLARALHSETSGGAHGQEPRRAFERLLVLRRGSSRFAAPVDEVYGTHRFSRDALGKVPATLGKARETLTTGVLSWGDRAVGLLDDELLFQVLTRSLG